MLSPIRHRAIARLPFRYRLFSSISPRPLLSNWSSSPPSAAGAAAGDETLDPPPATLTKDTLHPINQPDPLPEQAPSSSTDPYPIPLQSPSHASAFPSLAAREHPRLPPKEMGHPEGRPLDEDDATMRSRLVWCSRKRGIVEMELLLGTFVKGGVLDQMDRAELEEYDRLLTLPDWDIYYYAIRRRDPPPDSEWHASTVLEKLRKHAANEGKTVRKMPELLDIKHFAK